MADAAKKEDQEHIVDKPSATEPASQEAQPLPSLVRSLPPKKPTSCININLLCFAMQSLPEKLIYGLPGLPNHLLHKFQRLWLDLYYMESLNVCLLFHSLEKRACGNS